MYTCICIHMHIYIYTPNLFPNCNNILLLFICIVRND